ncbi:hypothetical protein VULLAG_LOCUS20949 [Vulpes lagopus]
MGAWVPSYHVWLAATQMPRDGHLKTSLSDIRNLDFRLSYLALVDGPVLSSACEDAHVHLTICEHARYG